MDFETQRKARMDNLEEKRRRLEEMRKQRQDRLDINQNTQNNIENTNQNQQSQDATQDERAQVDLLVNSILTSTHSFSGKDLVGDTDDLMHRYTCVHT